MRKETCVDICTVYRGYVKWSERLKTIGGRRDVVENPSTYPRYFQRTTMKWNRGVYRLNRITACRLQKTCTFRRKLVSKLPSRKILRLYACEPKIYKQPIYGVRRGNRRRFDGSFVSRRAATEERSGGRWGCRHAVEVVGGHHAWRRTILTCRQTIRGGENYSVTDSTAFRYRASRERSNS